METRGNPSSPIFTSQLDPEETIKGARAQQMFGSPSSSTSKKSSYYFVKDSLSQDIGFGFPVEQFLPSVEEDRKPIPSISIPGIEVFEPKIRTKVKIESSKI